MILGLDISTSTVGFTLMNLTGGVEYMWYVKPEGDNMYDKVSSAFNFIRIIVKPHVVLTGPVTAIYAEAPNIMFRAGFSTAQTLSKILRFNGALLFTLSTFYNILPQEAMAVSMRKQVIGRGRFAKGLDTKQEVLKWVQSQMPSFRWPVIDKGKNTGKTTPNALI